jgi:hypothetical protein
MKDLPHHIKKLNRRVIRSNHREEMEEEAFDLLAPPRKQTERQVKKQAKAKIRKERLSRAPTPLTPEEQNKKMAKRVPIFDRNKAKPRVAKPTKKKTPRI